MSFFHVNDDYLIRKKTFRQRNNIDNINLIDNIDIIEFDNIDHVNRSLIYYLVSDLIFIVLERVVVFDD